MCARMMCAIKVSFLEFMNENDWLLEKNKITYQTFVILEAINKAVVVDQQPYT